MPLLEGPDKPETPEGKPSPAEEAAVERMNRATWKVRRAIADTLRSLENSRTRCLGYLAALNYADYQMERRVQDRLLGQLSELKPSIRLMTLETALQRSLEAEARRG